MEMEPRETFRWKSKTPLLYRTHNSYCYLSALRLLSHNSKQIARKNLKRRLLVHTYAIMKKKREIITFFAFHADIFHEIERIRRMINFS